MTKTKKVFYATGFFEIGDTFYGEDEVRHTVTDILLCHYMRRGNYKVLYEVDNSGEFVELVLQENDMPDDIPQKPKLELKLCPGKSD